MTSHRGAHGTVGKSKEPWLLCALVFACGACSSEAVSFRSAQPLVTASGVELVVTVMDGQFKAKGETLVVADEDRRMRIEGDASVTLEQNHENAEGAGPRAIFSARAKRIEIDGAASVIRLKGAVHTRFSRVVQTDADGEY